MRESALPREQWELIVVDDGSPDDTGDVARQFADRVLRTGDAPRGPAFARNLGANDARADILLFVDADVLVHPHVLTTVLAHFGGDDALVAVFGAYDATPASPGLVSQYRNLLHRYVHLEGAGNASTFWAGIGAVRRATFESVGGFDACTYRRPQIEDVELGYRLHDAGGTVRLDPAISGTHLKRWTLGAMLRTDLFDRAVPWMRLLLDRHVVLRGGPLNTSRREQVMVGSTAVSLLALLLAIITFDIEWVAVTLAALALVIAGNVRLFAWFAAARGAGFALSTVPLRLLFYVVSVVGACIALAGIVFSERRTHAVASVAPHEAPAR